MRTLLLADDSITIQRVIALTFADEQFRVITVSDGQQAIDKMAAQRPDIVLAGTTMPNMNGYELARYVRSQPATKQVPVLLLTGAFEAVDDAKLAACGASGTLEKPFEPTTVISRVKELLGMKTDGAPGAAPAPARLQAVPPPLAKQSSPAAAAAAAVKAKPAAWDQLRHDTGLEPDTRSVEGGPHGAGGGAEYFDGLDAAFDSLDEQLRRPAQAAPPPQAQPRRSTDPRSPGRQPVNEAGPRSSNPVFEVDNEWFAEDEKTRAARAAEQKQLAAEMGINDVELPEPDRSRAAAPAKDMDSELGDALPAPAPPPPAPAPQLREKALPPKLRVPVADAFTTMLAREQGEPHDAPDPFTPQVQVTAPVIVQAAAPEITEAMLEQIAERVAAKLGAKLVTDEMRTSVTDTIRDTVRAVVSETSEKLVKDEINRIKSKL